MKIKKNIRIEGKHDKPILFDVFYDENSENQPVVIFAHGFKGFKDWGPWDRVAETFANAGFCFLKFNFSHNGTTPENPTEFDDLEAFGNNNYCIELDDLNCVIDWGCSNSELKTLNSERIYLIGHSRGGGITILKANEDTRVKKIVTWAAVSSFSNRISDEEIEQWKKQGVYYMENARTKQQMPLYIQIYDNYMANEYRLDISKAVKNIEQSFLIIHGTADPTVPVEEAILMKKWNNDADLLLIENANHSFDAVHPFEATEFPADFQKVMDATIDFLKGN
ncbi:MAG: alpha/beta hydrolase [Flavobacteriales bacterium]|nr:MAG: alpha/beta hydrolase [Flavobacteriales bacterium]